MIITHDDDSFNTNLIDKVELLADKCRLSIAGDPIKLKEYDIAKSQAESFKSALYLGTVPEYVANWATIKKWTPQQAADDILIAADKWSKVLTMVRINRLAAKENIRIASTALSKQKIYDDFEWLMKTNFAV